MITFTHRGNFNKTDKFLRAMQKHNFDVILRKYAEYGLVQLMQNTPVDTGIASNSWKYEIEKSRSGFNITWSNTDVTIEGTPIVILLQYGHGTGNGGYVQGYDFINPAMRPIFDKLSTDLWEEVTKA